MPILYGNATMNATVSNFAYKVRQEVQKRLSTLLKETDFDFLSIEASLFERTSYFVWSRKEGGVHLKESSEGKLLGLYELCREYSGTHAGNNYYNLTLFKELKDFYADLKSFTFFIHSGSNKCETCGEIAGIWMTTYSFKKGSSGSLPYRYFCMQCALDFHKENAPMPKIISPEAMAKKEKTKILKRIAVLLEKKEQINKELRQLRKAV